MTLEAEVLEDILAGVLRPEEVTAALRLDVESAREMAENRHARGAEEESRAPEEHRNKAVVRVGGSWSLGFWCGCWGRVGAGLAFERQ